MVIAAFLGTTLYVLAEELILTTYYPSPRGVYKELRVGSGNAAPPTAKLQVTLPTVETGLAVRVDDNDQPGGDTTPFVIDKDGNVGIGTSSPDTDTKLEVVTADSTSGLNGAGTLRLSSQFPQLDFVDSDHKDWAIHVNSNKLYFIREGWEVTDLVLDGAGRVGVGTADPGKTLDVNGEVRIRGGSPADVKYLRSNNTSGDATWDTIDLGTDTSGGYAGSSSEGGSNLGPPEASLVVPG